MSNRSRINWSSQEDQMLKQLKEVQNIQNWALIAEYINKISLYTRNAKQCRDRYRSNVKYGSLAGNQGESLDSMNLKWTEEEQHRILDLYNRFNSKWVLYIPFFKNRYIIFHHRSENNIKNRFYNTIKRNITKINKIISTSASTPKQKGMKKNKKQLKLNQVTCLFELCKKIQQSINISLSIEDTGSDNCNFNGNDHDHDENSYFNHLDLIQVKNLFIYGCRFGMEEEAVWGFLRELEKVEGVIGGIGIKRIRNKRFWKLDDRKFSYIISNDKIKDNKQSINSQHNNLQPEESVKYPQIQAQQGKSCKNSSTMARSGNQKNTIEQEQMPELKLLNIESEVDWIQKFNFTLLEL